MSNTKDQARTQIRRMARNCQEMGDGSEPLSENVLTQLVTDALSLLQAVEKYRRADQPAGDDT